MTDNDKFQFVRVNSKNMKSNHTVDDSVPNEHVSAADNIFPKEKYFDLLRNFYFGVCKAAFNEHELESYDDWEYVLQNNYMTFFIVILLEGEVIGGTVYEVYKKSSCAMLTY